MRSINMRDFIKALEELESSEGIKKEYIIDALKSALEAAYKENYNTEEEVTIEIKNDGEIAVSSTRKVVEKMEDEATETTLEIAKKFKKTAKIGDMVKVTIVPKNFGRIAVQKGKQIIVQKLREKEKEVRFEEYTNKIGDVITGIIQKADKGPVVLDLGKVEGIMPMREQVETENYQVNQKIRVYVQNVLVREKGDLQIIVSRRSTDFVKKLFENEIPEIQEGLIEIKAISRDAGKRSKIAVYSKNENIDPVGSCVGQKGMRIQSIIDELHGEKIDVVEWSEDPSKFIAEALLPAEIMAVDINEEDNFAQVIVPDNQLSLAIGKAGQNVRLSVELTGWKIDIKSISQFKELLDAKDNEEDEVEELENFEETEKTVEELDAEFDEELKEIQEIEELKEEQDEK